MSSVTSALYGTVLSALALGVCPQKGFYRPFQAHRHRMVAKSGSSLPDPFHHFTIPGVLALIPLFPSGNFAHPPRGGGHFFPLPIRPHPSLHSAPPPARSRGLARDMMRQGTPVLRLPLWAVAVTALVLWCAADDAAGVPVVLPASPYGGCAGNIVGPARTGRFYRRATSRTEEYFHVGTVPWVRQPDAGNADPSFYVVLIWDDSCSAKISARSTTHPWHPFTTAWWMSLSCPRAITASFKAPRVAGSLVQADLKMCAGSPTLTLHAVRSSHTCPIRVGGRTLPVRAWKVTRHSAQSAKSTARTRPAMTSCHSALNFEPFPRMGLG